MAAALVLPATAIARAPGAPAVRPRLHLLLTDVRLEGTPRPAFVNFTPVARPAFLNFTPVAPPAFVPCPRLAWVAAILSLGLAIVADTLGESWMQAGVSVDRTPAGAIRGVAVVNQILGGGGRYVNDLWSRLKASHGGVAVRPGKKGPAFVMKFR